jgi:magnesium-protoporphyrin O-methyltransferase
VTCSCCSGESLDIFGERSARRELRRYLRKGLGGDDARQMAGWAEDTGLDGATVVEVGGGIGQVQAELLRRGAAHGTVVEVVDAYAGAAAELARATGIAGKSTFLLADLLETPEAVEPADIVVLRRVVCCSPDGPALLGAAAGKARRTLLASYPRDRVITRAFVRVQNGLFALLRRRFRVYVHPPGRLEEAASAHGLCRARVARGAIWETVQFERAPS